MLVLVGLENKAGSPTNEDEDIHWQHADFSVMVI